jgi:hypothetical protein
MINELKTKYNKLGLVKNRLQLYKQTDINKGPKILIIIIII